MQSHCCAIDNSSFVIVRPDGEEIFVNISDKTIDVGRRRKPGEEYPTFQMTKWLDQ